MKIFAALLAAGALLPSPLAAMEIRSCHAQLRTAPLNDERGVQSLLVQAIAIVNDGKSAVRIAGLDFDLLAKGVLRDRRSLDVADVAKAVASAPQIAAMNRIFPSQFCNGALLRGAALANADLIAPGEAVVFLYQPFAWKGARDTLRLTAREEGKGETVRDFPIRAEASATPALFPIAGRSYVGAGASFQSHHRWASVEEFALDIAMLDGAATHKGDGLVLSDYRIYGAPVRAVADGVVARTKADVPDNVAMLKRTGETDAAYLDRLIEAQTTLLSQGIEAVQGNYVIVDHRNGEFSVYAHLKPESVRVKPGDSVGTGETIGTVGSSGNSTEPHLHFQMCDTADIATCRAIPTVFRGVRLPLELAPRSIQSGDIVETSE
ncbi:MAG: M23 family metallopeptidase [Sphingopyxis sp.]|nr:M23 family metallopeptidase [Sphingopyxis sp.]